MAEHKATAQHNNTYSCQDNRTEKTLAYFMQDETKTEQTQSDKLQSGGGRQESKYCTYKFSIVNIN